MASALSQQLVDGGFRVRRIKRPLDATVDIDAFIDHDAQIAFHQRRWLLPGEIVEAWHAQIADFQDVTEALGGDQAGFGPFSSRMAFEATVVACSTSSTLAPW